MQKQKSPLVVFIDIETQPILGYTWGTHEQDVIKVVNDWKLLCFAYSINKGKVNCIHGDEKKVVNELWKIIDQADIVVAHNVPFDLKKSEAKFIEYGLKPPSPYLTIDTLKEARKHFSFTSNKLDFLGMKLGVGRKVKHPGFEMWEGCMAGEKKSWDLMVKYNKMDVSLLIKVYERLHPWIHRNKLHWETKRECIHCGSMDTQRRGRQVNNGGTFQRHQCRACARWFIGDKIVQKF